MKKTEIPRRKFESLSEVHRFFEIPQPLHPLISLIDHSKTPVEMRRFPHSHILTFYKIAYKAKLSGKFKYGQGYYDFDEGGLLFAAPGQVIGTADDMAEVECSHYTLLIHPDFLINHPLGKKIRQYGFFSYSANEALHLSEQEKKTVTAIFEILLAELNSRIDDFSQDVMISQVELLLNYANRFYKRQFITRKVSSNDLLQKMDEILNDYFDRETSLDKGLPTVHYLAEKLTVSSSYLSDMLRSLTDQNAQQHIHQKLIEKAKEKLSTTSLTVSEVAYELGFEHPQSFSKLFKIKTSLSPLEFRRSFN
ncbi:MAG: AraC family transcriptional regulator [Chitinophagaceae bacterium]|nr:MAG: AraC family transcriptional regulator [Chitinophagaceae bacterium]